MLSNLGLATLMVTGTVVIHFAGLLALMRLLRFRGHHFKAHVSVPGQFFLLILVVLGLVAIHSVEIWLYAFVYVALGAIGDLHTALYFSTVTFATLGYGDVLLTRDWRLFGAIEAANGLILFAWSTAFLISLTSRLRALEHDWLETSGAREPAGAAEVKRVSKATGQTE